MKKFGKVLIVDQRKSETEALKKELVRHGFEVMTAQNSKDGMKKAWKERPDLMVFQAKTQSKKDAVEICRNYKTEDKQFKYVPILMMIEGEDYIANSLFENPRWSPLEAFDSKPEKVKTVISAVEKAINDSLENTFVILPGYYKEEKDESTQGAHYENNLSHKSA